MARSAGVLAGARADLASLGQEEFLKRYFHRDGWGREELEQILRKAGLMEEKGATAQLQRVVGEDMGSRALSAVLRSPFSGMAEPQRQSAEDEGQVLQREAGRPPAATAPTRGVQQGPVAGRATAQPGAAATAGPGSKGSQGKVAGKTAPSQRPGGRGAAAGKGEPPSPVAGARLSSRYGLRKDPVGGTNTSQFHKGIDLAAPTGTAITSVADGKVVFIGNQRGKSSDSMRILGQNAEIERCDRVNPRRAS